MKKNLLTNVMLALSLVVVLYLPSRAHAAADLTCKTSYRGGEYNNVTVPTSGVCSLTGVIVLGKITVETKATLNLNDGTVIGGDVIATGCEAVQIHPGDSKIMIGGNLTVIGCTGGYQGSDGVADKPNIIVNGNVICSNNKSTCDLVAMKVGQNVICTGNLGAQFVPGTCDLLVLSVGQDLTCSGNIDCSVFEVTSGGNATLNDNKDGLAGGVGFGGQISIGGDLSCTGNARISTLLARIEVKGKATGQCSGLLQRLE